jgi:hypothetical protein
VSRADRLLLLALYVGLSSILSWAHAARVDRPAAARKAALHEAVLENEAPDPYQYKLAPISWAMEGARRATGASLRTVFDWNTALSLLALLLAHHAWLARLYGTRAAVLGTLLLAGLAHGLFLDYFHHPYEFWGLAGFCLLCRAVAAERGVATLAALALVTGFVWEKHALVPLLAGARRWRRGEPLLRTVAGAAVAFAGALAVPVLVRVLCGGDRPSVDVTELSEQRWGRVLAHHLPYVLPPFLVLVLRGRLVPDWVRWLWWYVPALFLAYLASRFLVHELRSFWAWAPVFTATLAAWARTLPGDAVPAARPPA